MTAGERTIALDDGAATALEIWGTRGPLVLAVHGMTSSRKSWTRLANALDGRFRIAAYDQRGHGDSAGVPGPMTLERGVRDLENVAAAVGEPIHALIGHSWGGAVAITGGERLPVARVAAVDPMIRQVPDAWYAEFLEELGEHFALQGEARDARTRTDYAGWSPADVEGKVHAVRTMTVEPIERLLRENPPSHWDLRATIARYPKPLLLAMAVPDEGINETATLLDVEANHSPNVEIVSFPGGGHNLHRTQFDAFAAAVAAFLAQR